MLNDLNNDREEEIKERQNEDGVYANGLFK